MFRNKKKNVELTHWKKSYFILRHRERLSASDLKKRKEKRNDDGKLKMKLKIEEKNKK